jgi:hypothetical protein
MQSVEGASALADALKVNKSLTSINLDYNQIGAEGASALADALKMNRTLKSINLCVNAIGNEGASALADALKVNTAVTTINLRYNRIGNEGALTLADPLKVNTSVTCINLDNNATDGPNRARLSALIARNKRLRHLFFFDARPGLGLGLTAASTCSSNVAGHGAADMV